MKSSPFWVLQSLWKARFAIAILAFTAYAPTLRLGFLWDDHVMIESNQTLRQWSYENLKHDFTSDVFNRRGDAYYRPTSTLLNRWDYSIWTLRPFGYHLTNLLIHTGNALLIAELALVLGALPLMAFLMASLFAVHPIVVEQLMIVAGRAELMALFFTFLTIYFFLKESTVSKVWGGAAFGVALFTKESAVVIPILLALVYYFQKRSLRSYKSLLWLLAALVPYAWIRHQAVGPLIPHQDLWLTTRFFVQEFPSVVLGYISLLLVPWNLHSHRLLPHISPIWPLYLLGVAGGCYFAVKKYHRAAILCIGWYLLVLLPKTPVMIYGNFMLDHWAYPAAISLIVPIAWLILCGLRSRKDKNRAMAAGLYFFLLIVWSLLVHLNVALRGTDEKMYRWALNFTTSNPVKYNLGLLLVQTGRPADAVGYLEDVRSIYPEDANNLNLLAHTYWLLGNRWLAVSLLEDFARHYPQDLATRTHLQRLKSLLSSKK